MSKLNNIAQASARGGFYLFAGNIIQFAVLAIGSIVIARLLGSENYGLYSLSIVGPTIFLGLIDFGLGSALTRFSAKLVAEGNSQFAADILKVGFIFRSVTGFVLAASCFFFSDSIAAFVLNRPDMGFFIRISAWIVFFQTVFSTLSSIFVGVDKMENNALLMNLQAVTKTVLSVVLIVLGFSLVGVIAGHLLSYVVASIVGSFLFIEYSKTLGKASIRVFTSNLKVLLNYGLPLYGSTIITLLMSQFQTVILAFFVSNAEIGNFAIAANLSALVNVLIFPLAALFPAFSKANPENGELKSIFKTSTKYTSLLILPATVLVIILSKDIVSTLYGSAYDLAPFFLQLYILSFLFAGLGSMVLGYLFNGTGETRIIFLGSAVGLLIFLPLGVLLTLFFSVPGMIIASLISSFFTLIYSLYMMTKRLHIKLNLSWCLRIYLAAFLSAAPVLAFTQVLPAVGLINLAVGIPLFLLMYLILLPLVRAINLSDVENLQSMFGKVRAVSFFLKPICNFETKLIALNFRRL